MKDVSGPFCLEHIYRLDTQINGKICCLILDNLSSAALSRVNGVTCMSPK